MSETYTVTVAVDGETVATVEIEDRDPTRLGDLWFTVRDKNDIDRGSMFSIGLAGEDALNMAWSHIFKRRGGLRVMPNGEPDNSDDRP